MGALPGAAVVGAGVVPPGDEIEAEEDVVMIGETPTFGRSRRTPFRKRRCSLELTLPFRKRWRHHDVSVGCDGRHDPALG